MSDRATRINAIAERYTREEIKAVLVSIKHDINYPEDQLPILAAEPDELGDELGDEYREWTEALEIVIGHDGTS